MEGETTKKDLESLLESIKSCDVLENRISLLGQIGDSYQSDTSDVALLIERLVTFWENSSFFSISQCMLNKAVLHVAAKYLESDIFNCLSQFLILGIKAIIWCKKNLQLAFMSNEEARDEDHSNLFCQLILDTLSYSFTCISTLSRSTILGEKMVMLSIENFIFEMLNLTKALIFEVQKFHSISSEVLKMTQMVLDAAIKLCRAYFHAIRQDSMEPQEDEAEYVSHIVAMTATTIETLYELGIFAASGGGNLVTVLNVSWKGVVLLLQLDKGALAERVNIGDIMLTLISLAIETLRCAAEAWSSAIKEPLTVSEAKRTFLPIKFYLINAVRISSEYPCKAVNIYKDISRCLLLITSLGILLSKETRLRAAGEALMEFLEPTSFLLLQTLLNSSDIKLESKSQILDWLFAMGTERDADNSVDSFSSIFAVNCDDMPKSEVLMLGRLNLFINLLKSSSAIKDDEVVCEISTKIYLLMDALMHEDVYASILSLHVPVLSASGPAPGVTWEPMLSCLLHSLKTFLIVASSNKLAWCELGTFLLENLFHPHFLCLDIVRELWSFIMRHAEMDAINQMLDRLCILFKTMARSEPALDPLSPLRKMARSICHLITGTSSAVVDQVYTSVASDGNSQLSSVMLIALLLEGFPLDSLSNNLKMSAIRKFVAAFHGFVESNSKELKLNGSSGSSDLIGLPVHTLSSAMRCCNIKSRDIIDGKDLPKVLKFATSLIHGFRKATDGGTKEHYVKILAATLDIISSSKQSYISDEMKEVVLELQTLFMSTSDSDSILYRCKPSLVSLMLSIGHAEISGGEGGELYSAVLSLYHVLLRDRHWAFNHLAVAAFANFAACTSCSELWRFIPDDAALSFDISTGKEANEGAFMSELRGYLEKEAASREITTSCKELVNEGTVLRKLSSAPHKVAKKRRRELPDGVCEGMELLQSGLKVMRNAVVGADSDEVKDMFSPHISCLEDAISHLAGLSDNV